MEEPYKTHQQEYDVIIIGAGTAGLSASIYAARAGKKTLVIEGAMYGGQIVNSMEVENYPGIPHITGYEFATNLYGQAEALGVVMEWETVIGMEEVEDSPKGKKCVKTTSQNFIGRNVIIATGVKKRSLGIQREQQFVGRGISYCATCDGAFYKGKDVAVIGGGNTAIMDVIYLSKFCKRVFLVHRRDEFRGESSKLEQIRGLENVTIMTPYYPVALLGENQISGITLEQNTDEKKQMDIQVQGVFVAIGQQPSNDPFGDFVELDEAGYIIAGEDCRTNQEGVFAVGDCRTKFLRQLTTAAADGAIAATQIV